MSTGREIIDNLRTYGESVCLIGSGETMPDDPDGALAWLVDHVDVYVDDDGVEHDPPGFTPVDGVIAQTIVNNVYKALQNGYHVGDAAVYLIEAHTEAPYDGGSPHPMVVDTATRNGSTVTGAAYTYPQDLTCPITSTSPAYSFWRLDVSVSAVGGAGYVILAHDGDPSHFATLGGASAGTYTASYSRFDDDGSNLGVWFNTDGLVATSILAEPGTTDVTCSITLTYLYDDHC